MTRTTHLVRLVVLGLGIAPLACSDGGQMNIGNTQKLGGQLSDYVATWDGHAQAFAFSDGSDHVHLTIDSTGAGTLTVGQSPALPPATDPHVGYPVGSGNFFQAVQPGQLDPPFPGFAYPLHATQVQSDRIQTGLDPSDVYTGWCALQTPMAVTDPSTGLSGFSCAPAATKIEHPVPDSPDCILDQADGTSQTVDCGWLSLCWLPSVCTCIQTACTALLTPDGTPVTQYPGEIDGQLDATGTTLTGTLLLPGAGRVTVVLEKQN
jgi:hypothetical protein